MKTIILIIFSIFILVSCQANKYIENDILENTPIEVKVIKNVERINKKIKYRKEHQEKYKTSPQLSPSGEGVEGEILNKTAT
ncbi:hypothetical protein HOG27_05375 [bacterium]|jgi:hypothetical protein|nr:hypothetical protein [bacterium]